MKLLKILLKFYWSIISQIKWIKVKWNSCKRFVFIEGKFNTKSKLLFLTLEFITNTEKIPFLFANLIVGVSFKEYYVEGI